MLPPLLTAYRRGLSLSCSYHVNLQRREELQGKDNENLHTGPGHVLLALTELPTGLTCNPGCSSY